jgi:penicillin-insensitive murein DD-endopeptidase
MVRALTRGILLLAIAFAWPEAAAAAPARSPARKGPAPRLPRPGPPRSLGAPTQGRLADGVELTASAGLRLMRPKGPRWGTAELIDLIERGARRVGERFPGSVLLVGDLSSRHGGDLAGHRSHESGRDADIGFYFVDAQGRAVQNHRFHAVDWRGRAVSAPELRFDDARNWALVEAFMTDPRARVQHIFVAEPIRARLLAHARSKGVYLPVLHRASIALKQPSRGLPHDDHFHVRVACPPRQADACIAEPPRGGEAPEARALLVKRAKGRKNTVSGPRPPRAAAGARAQSTQSASR